MRSAPATYSAAALLFKGAEKNLRLRRPTPQRAQRLTSSLLGTVPAYREPLSRLRRFLLSNLSFLTLLDVSQKIQSRALSPVEVTKAELDRIAALDPKLKSYATVMADSAMAKAKQAEVEIGRGEVKGPLHGVPIAVKDLCWTTNAPTAAGMTIHKDYMPSEDATVVKRLSDAGAIILGKLQLTEALTPIIIPMSRHRAIPGMRMRGQALPLVARVSRRRPAFATVLWVPTQAAPFGFPRPRMASPVSSPRGAE
jgi:Amidase